MLHTKWVRILIGILVTLLALWLSFRNLNWEDLKAAFLEVKLFWVALALANSIFTVYALGWRWKLLLNPKKNIPLKSLFKLNIINQYVNIIMPLRFGEIIRAYLAAKQYQISGAFIMGTIAIEKVLDFFIFVVLWILVPAFFVLREKVRGYRIALLFCLLTLGFMILAVRKPGLILKGMNSLARLLPQKIRLWFSNFFERGLAAFSQLKNAKSVLILMMLTLAFVGSQVLTNFFLFKAFKMDLSFWAALFLLLAIQVGNIPPSVPGKIGIFEYAVILALSLFSIPKSQALSYGLMLHAVAFLPKILIGFFVITTMDISLRKNYIAKDDEN